ncbi:MAG: DUF4340 domain-containing protein [Myxococcota bacterium]
MATTDTKLVAALAVLAVLGGGLYLTNKKQDEEAKAYSLNARAADLPKIEISDDDVSKINKVVLHKPGKEGAAGVDVTLVKKGEEWRLEQPVDAEANQANVKSMLDNLKTLKVSEVIDPGKADYAKFKVSDDLGFHVTVHKDNAVVLDAFFGDNGGRGQMTRIAGKDGVYAVKGYSDYLYNREVKAWREMSLFKFEEVDVESVNVDNENGSFAFTKKDGNWVSKYKPAKGAGGEIKKFDSGKVLDLIRAYRTLSADNFAEKGKTAADLGLEKPVATVLFTLKDGAKREVKVGSTAEGSSRWVQVSGKNEFFSISSWAADWATADEKKFQKSDEPKDKPPASPHGMPPGMPPGMGAPPM